MSQSEQDKLIEILENIGLEDPTKPVAPEILFFNHYTAGLAPRIDNARIWLANEMSVWSSLQLHDDLMLCSRTKEGRRYAAPAQVARALLRHYFYMYHLTMFKQEGGRGQCDIDKFLDLVLAYEPIAKIVQDAAKDS